MLCAKRRFLPSFSEKVRLLLRSTRTVGVSLLILATNRAGTSLTAGQAFSLTPSYINFWDVSTESLTYVPRLGPSA